MPWITFTHPCALFIDMNMCVAPQAIMACCVYAREKEGGKEGLEIDVDELQLMNRCAP